MLYIIMYYISRYIRALFLRCEMPLNCRKLIIQKGLLISKMEIMSPYIGESCVYVQKALIGSNAFKGTRNQF